MDKLSCHKTAEVERLIRAAGAEQRKLPAYSPDLNPIEKMFSKLKEFLRSAAARTVDKPGQFHSDVANYPKILYFECARESFTRRHSHGSSA
ncbi:MAG: transposase [Planctomycetota bacterium]|nr:transposase [Planctomycetota bacterium]